MFRILKVNCSRQLSQGTGSLKVTCLENDVIGDGVSTVKISQEADSNEVLSVDVTCQDNDSANINLSKIDDSSNVLEASQG